MPYPCSRCGLVMEVAQPGAKDSSGRVIASEPREILCQDCLFEVNMKLLKACGT